MCSAFLQVKGQVCAYRGLWCRTIPGWVTGIPLQLPAAHAAGFMALVSNWTALL